VGSDADLVLWNETLRSTISIDGLHDNMDYTPYQGLELEGYPVTTVSRGKIIWHEGRALGMPGWGELLHRDKPRHHLRAGER
jgi:dihydropyrimidinase